MSLRTFFKAAGSYDLRPRLKAITAPVLLLQGRRDPLAVGVLRQTSEQGYPSCDFTLARIADEPREE
jgi:pimeloyl-ACP methyl ester carboxylesterase